MAADGYPYLGGREKMKQALKYPRNGTRRLMLYFAAAAIVMSAMHYFRT